MPRCPPKPRPPPPPLWLRGKPLEPVEFLPVWWRFFLELEPKLFLCWPIMPRACVAPSQSQRWTAPLLTALARLEMWRPKNLTITSTDKFGVDWTTRLAMKASNRPGWMIILRSDQFLQAARAMFLASLLISLKSSPNLTKESSEGSARMALTLPWTLAKFSEVKFFNSRLLLVVSC